MDQLPLWSGVRQPASVAVGDDVSSSSVPIVLDVSSVRAWLESVLERPVQLVFTNNRSTMISAKESGPQLSLRIHRMFLEAPTDVWQALAAYLGDDDRDAGRVVDAFIRQRSESLPRPPVKLRPQGRVHDLLQIFDELNALYFRGACSAQVTWGGAGTRRRRRSIQLGSYVADDRLIRIHPCLDQSFVPRHYVAWVVFHEMLHEVFGVPGHGGRGSVHPPEFIALEETYPEYELCQRWEKKNLARLLRYQPPKR